MIDSAGGEAASESLGRASEQEKGAVEDHDYDPACRAISDDLLCLRPC